jgi:hypothetical protein
VVEGAAAFEPDRVLVAVDGSETGARALPHAHALAGRFGVPVVTVHAGDGDVRADLRLDGDPASALLAELERRPRTLLCLASHGRSGLRRAVLGSVAEAVVREAVSPVLVVGPEVEIRPPVVLPRTLLVAVGHGGDRRGLGDVADAWAGVLGAQVVRAHVGEAAPADGVRLVAGHDPAMALLDVARELPPPCWFVAGAPEADGGAANAVAFRLVRQATGPVLTRARSGSTS